MRRVMRSLWMCLLMVALPIQGMAAVSMQHCAAMHERMQSLSTAAPMEAQSQATGHEHLHGSDAAQGHHGHHGHEAEDHGVSATAPDTTTSTHASTSTCSACAACCSALGLPASAIQMPSPLPDVPVVQLPLRDVDSFIADGLDRPPRRFLA